MEHLWTQNRVVIIGAGDCLCQLQEVLIILTLLGQHPLECVTSQIKVSAQFRNNFYNINSERHLICDAALQPPISDELLHLVGVHLRHLQAAAPGHQR